MSWASSIRPPTLQQAINQHPLAKLITCNQYHQLIVVDGSSNDWWHESTDSYEFVHIIHIRCPDTAGVLVAGLAVDNEIKEKIWKRSSGRWIFWTTKELVVLLAFADKYDQINLCRKLRGIHKPFFSFGIKWPSEREVENLLTT